MSSPTIISGKSGKVTYGVTPTVLAITKWTLKITGGVLKVPNTTDGMRRIAGLPDAEGTIVVHVDTAATTEADLAVNTILTSLKLFTDGTKSYSYTSAIITDVEYGNEVEGTYDATISWALAVGAPVNAPA